MNQPLAYVHPQAKIARNVVIEPFTTIHNNVKIGSGTWIGSNVTIMEGAIIGKNCRIFPGAVISAIPQDLKFNDEETTVEIGDLLGEDLGGPPRAEGVLLRDGQSSADSGHWARQQLPQGRPVESLGEMAGDVHRRSRWEG